MAMIDEGGMLRVMKDAYKATGYIVINDAGTVTIRTEFWMTQMPIRMLPRKVLALLVEHIGTIPEDKEAFRCSKGGGAQTLVFEIEQESTQKAEAYFEEAMQTVKETQLVFKDCRIWQAPETMQTIAINPDYMRIISRKDMGAAGLNAEKYLLLIEDEDGIRVVIAGVRLQEAERAYIEGFPWVM